jgi:hypothetical protein
METGGNMSKRRDLTFGIQGLEAVKQAARREVSKLFHRAKKQYKS